MQLYNLYKISKEHLKKANNPSSENEAMLIISEILALPKWIIFTEKERRISPRDASKVLIAVKKRAKGVPLAYILGYQYFYKDKFIVDRSTFIPRPDTEHLLYAVEETKRCFNNILDVCCGCGAIALSLSRLFPGSRITGIDKDIKVALKNKKTLGRENVTFLKVDFLKGKWKPEDKFDLLISNPPYLSREDFSLLDSSARFFEPYRSFYGGEDGLIFYRRIVEFSNQHLREDGVIIVETDHKWRKVAEIFDKNRYRKIEVRKDYNNLERVIIAYK